jgi:hypothetical protein
VPCGDTTWIGGGAIGADPERSRQGGDPLNGACRARKGVGGSGGVWCRGRWEPRPLRRQRSFRRRCAPWEGCNRLLPGGLGREASGSAAPAGQGAFGPLKGRARPAGNRAWALRPCRPRRLGGDRAARGNAGGEPGRGASVPPPNRERELGLDRRETG